MLQAIATIAILALIFWTLGLPALRMADAANLTLVSDTIGDATPSATTYHDIEFTIPTGGGVGDSETIVVTFDAGFTGSAAVTLSDIDLEIDDVDETVVASGAADGQWEFDFTGSVFTITSGGASSVINAGEKVNIKIGSNADSGTNRLINPGSEGSYDIDIVAGSDTGSTKVAIINGVTVSASVDTIFSFTVSGTATGTTMAGDTSTVASGTTTIPFGLLSAGAATSSAQLLTVSTNASNGYSVSVLADGDLESSTGANINSFANGSDLNTPAAWSSPSGTLGSSNTYGHWGVTTDDTETFRTGGEFDGVDNYVGVSSTTARVIMGHDGPANGEGVGVGTTTVGYKIEISALQEAGDDYSAVLTYIATPTF